MSGLKPCPFCGGRATPPEPYGFHPDYQGRFIQCQTCHASIYHYRPTKAEMDAALVESWNKRAPNASDLWNFTTTTSNYFQDLKNEIAAVIQNSTISGLAINLDGLLRSAQSKSELVEAWRKRLLPDNYPP